MARILGVDPGTWKTGAGLLDLTGNKFVLVHAEIITVTQQIPLAQRLLIIFRSLSEIIHASYLSMRFPFLFQMLKYKRSILDELS